MDKMRLDGYLGDNAAKLRELTVYDDDGFREGLREIGTVVNHQLTFEADTGAAVILAVDLLPALDGDFYRQFVLFGEVGAWIASEGLGGIEHLDGELRDAYEECVQKLKGVVQNFIKANRAAIGECDEEEVQIFAIGALAILADKLAAAALLLGYSWEEFEIVCPRCGDFEEVLALEEDEALTPAEAASPWHGEDFADAYSWLSALLAEWGEEMLAEKLACLYGDYTCPECGFTGSVWDFIKAGLV